MRIILKTKTTNNSNISGHLSSTRFYDNFNAHICYGTNPEFFIEFQKLLLKYYKLHLIGAKINTNRSPFLKEVFDTSKPNKYNLSRVEGVRKRDERRKQLKLKEEKN